MNKQSLPPIIKLAERFMLASDKVLRGFSRYHKYTFGTQLHSEAMTLVKQAYTAWQHSKQQTSKLGFTLAKNDNGVVGKKLR